MIPLAKEDDLGESIGKDVFGKVWTAVPVIFSLIFIYYNARKTNDKVVSNENKEITEHNQTKLSVKERTLESRTKSLKEKKESLEVSHLILKRIYELSEGDEKVLAEKQMSAKQDQIGKVKTRIDELTNRQSNLEIH